MKQHSIRERLVIGIMVSMIFILGGMGLWSQLVAQHESEEIFSARLATSARVLESLTAKQLEKATLVNPIIITLPHETADDHSIPQDDYGHPYESKLAFQVWHEDGQLLAKSESAPNLPLGQFKSGFTKNQLNNEIWHVFALSSGKVWVLAAEKDAVRQEMANDLRVSILTPLAAGALLLLIVVNVIAITNLRPLQALASLISHREPQVTTDIKLNDTPTELSPVINELNHLLKRVRDAFKREQRFIDAAAHEIRTPIAALQIHIENAVNSKDPSEREKSLAEALKGLRRTSRLTEQLLTFSRVSGSVDKEQKQLLSLDGICKEIIETTEPILSQRGQTISFEARGDFVISGEQHKIERVIQNLIDNASQYGLSNGNITVSLEEVNQLIRLSVSNDGNPIPDSEKENVFNPYYRILGSKSFGSGLGLAIVKEIINQHGGQIHIEDKTPGHGTKVVVEFTSVA